MTRRRDNPPADPAGRQREADRFFTRYWGPTAIAKLREERYSPALRAAAAEAKTATTWAAIEQERADRISAFRRAVESPLLDDISRNLLRRTRGIRRQNAQQLESNERAADRFFQRVDGQNLASETTGHVRWARSLRERSSREVYRRWAEAPIDPITHEEAQTVMTKTPRAKWQAILRAAAKSRRFDHEVQPAGMSLDRALEIAIAAAEAREE